MADILISRKSGMLCLTGVTKEGGRWLIDTFEHGTVKVYRPVEHLEDLEKLAKNAGLEVEAH